MKEFVIITILYPANVVSIRKCVISGRFYVVSPQNYVVSLQKYVVSIIVCESYPSYIYQSMPEKIDFQEY
jgi:hypothetical protein